MTNGSKVLLSLLLLIIASTAFASSAGAGEITAEKYPAVVTGGQEGSLFNNYVETTAGRKFHCKTVTGEATLTEASATVFVTPHLAGCVSTVSGIEISTTVHSNGCTFQVTAGETTSPSATHGSLKIACPEGQRIMVTIATCRIHIGPQEISGSVALSNLASGQITASTNANHELHYEETDAFLCPFEGNTTLTSGNLVGQVLITGYDGDQGEVEDPVTPGTIDHKHSFNEQAIHVK